MQIIEKRGNPELAEIFVAKLREKTDALVEFVDAIDPRYSRDEKWVITVSTQFGCPVKCLICDAGRFFAGNLTEEEIIGEIDYVLKRRFPDGVVQCRKFKIHFARMGEPALNPSVLNVLEKLPFLYNAPGLIPCIPTIAPLSASQWFEKLLDIKRRLYQNGHFQLQFSINSTDEKVRDIIMPVRKWNFEKISEFGQRWFESGDRKVVLNFALAHDIPVDPGVIKEYFSPDCFMVKLTPVNPTWNAQKNGYNTVICSSNPNGASHLVRALQHFGFDCVVSIGDEREIEIGSNCGQAASLVMERENSVKFEGVENGN